MNVSKGLRIERVTYGHRAPIEIIVTPLWLADGGSVAAALAQEAVHTTQTKLTTRAVVNGRADGQWGDQEVEEEVRIAVRIEMRREKVTRTVTTKIASNDPSKPATEKTEEVTQEEPVAHEVIRFPDLTSIVWE